MIGRHEGAGRVAEVGEGVTEVAVGDPVVMTFLPSCGRCSDCVRGYTALCDDGYAATIVPQLDGTYAATPRGEDVGQMCLLGTFARHTAVPVKSVVKIDEGIPLELAALVGCGVTTGFGSAVRTAVLEPGDTRW
jgi:Zn-dependent alcohol dehydrogenase